MTKLITGGLGDFNTILNHCPELPKKILVAARGAGAIAEMAYLMGIECTVLEDMRVYFTKFEVQAVHGGDNHDLNKAEDWSISRTFPMIMDGPWKYERNAFEKLRLPKKVSGRYAVMNADSRNLIAGRKMSIEEQEWVFKHTDLPIVILGASPMQFPKNPRIMDLNGKTNLRESLAIIKHASVCYGIDSWITSAAIQWGYPVWIKSINPQYYQCIKCYQAPGHKDIHTMSFLS